MVLIVKIFVDDIIFGRNNVLSKKFVEHMSIEFEMYMFGEIKFFI
jgi:hypothetical protein